MILSDFPDRAVDGTTTYAGFLRKNYDMIFARCSESTKEQYDNIYNHVLLPFIPKEMPLRSMGSGVYMKVMADIRRLKDGEKYDRATVEQYRRLLLRVHEAAAELGLCRPLWGTAIHVETEIEDSKALLTPKSLSMQAEIIIFAYLSKAVDEDGEYVGLLIMLLIGLRNNECAALTYGDISPLSEFPDTYTLRIFKSTKRNSSKVKGSGKTRNANRIVPIPDMLRDFLLKRKAHIEALIDSGELTLPRGVRSVDELPIVTQKDSFVSPCSSSDLSMAGSKMLKDIGMPEQDVAGIDQYLQLTDNPFEDEAGEKDPSTYLLRRNAATHYWNLGMPLPWIQYLMGHDISTSIESRNAFSHEEKLQEMKEFIDMHPLCPSDSKRNFATHSQNATFVAKGNRTTVFAVKVREPGDCLSIKAESSAPFDVDLHTCPMPEQFDHEVYMQQKIIDIYREKKGEL